MAKVIKQEEPRWDRDFHVMSGAGGGGGTPDRGGISGAATHHFTAKGHNVVAIDKDECRLQQTLDDVADNPGRVLGITADMTDEDELKPIMKSIGEWIGPDKKVRGVVSTVGSALKPKLDTPEQDSASYRRFFDLNVVTGLNAARIAAEFSAESMLFVGSNNGERGFGAAAQLGYGISKQALRGVINILPAFFPQMRVNMIQVGIVYTASDNWRDRLASDSNARRYPAFLNPHRRLVTKEEVAETIYWLSCAATAINGAIIPVDLGLQATGFMHPGLDIRDFRESWATLMRDFLNAEATPC